MNELKIPACFALADLQQLMNQSHDQFTIIDVRDPEEYIAKHIPGAINIPIRDLESRTNELSKEAIIITACGKGGGRSALGAELLQQFGFKNVQFLCGGTIGWFDAF